jgi:hypothetical protein
MGEIEAYPDYWQCRVARTVAETEERYSNG